MNADNVDSASKGIDRETISDHKQLKEPIELHLGRHQHNQAILIKKVASNRK